MSGGSKRATSLAANSRSGARTTLVIAIPERWEDETGPVEWALLRPDGEIEREGSGLTGDLPAASKARVVLPAGRVFLTSVKLPARGAKRMRGALAYAIEDQITSDPETVHAVAGPALDDGTHAIAVVDKNWLRRLLAALDSAGTHPRSVTAETCLAPRDAEGWTVVLRGGAGFVRTGDASGFALDCGDSRSPPQTLKLALENARRTGAPPAIIALHADVEIDAPAWSRDLGCQCELRHPWRAWHCVEQTDIEFLQGEFAPTQGAGAPWPRLRLAAMFAAAAIAIEVTGTFVHWAALRHEKARLEAQMRKTFKAAFPEAQAIVDPALQMRRNLEAARRAAGIAQESDFLPLLVEVSKYTYATAGARLRALTYEPGRLTLEVRLASRAEADPLLRAFANAHVAARLETIHENGSNVEARFAFVPGAWR